MAREVTPSLTLAALFTEAVLATEFKLSYDPCFFIGVWCTAHDGRLLEDGDKLTLLIGANKPNLAAQSKYL